MATSVWDGVDVLEGPACAELSELLEIHGLVCHLPSNSGRTQMLKNSVHFLTHPINKRHDQVKHVQYV